MGKSPFGFPHVWSTLLALIAAALIAQVADCLLICTDLVYRAAKSRSSTPSSRDIILESAGLGGTCDVYMLYEVALHTKAVLVASESGRIVGQWQRGRLWGNLGRRFMWWGPQAQAVVRGERRNAWQKCIVLCGAWLATLLFVFITY